MVKVRTKYKVTRGLSTLLSNYIVTYEMLWVLLVWVMATSLALGSSQEEGWSCLLTYIWGSSPGQCLGELPLKL